MRLVPLLLACTLASALPAVAQAAPYRSMQQILEASPAADWRTPDPSQTLYLELPAGRVVIELAPQFAPQHVANIKALAQARFWDGTSVYRVQDNFVAQFGDADADDPAKARPLAGARHLPAEFARPSQGLAFSPLPDRDGWAREVGFVDGFPVARDGTDGRTWLAHCYGAVGAVATTPRTAASARSFTW